MWIDYNEKYEVSSDGHIRNKKSGRILHEFINKNGYLITQFDGKTRTVHRVVASVYLDNPNKCEDINHKTKLEMTSGEISASGLRNCLTVN